MEEVRRGSAANLIGGAILRLVERLPSPARNRVRSALWRSRTYLEVNSGHDLISGALRGFPVEVRALCAKALVRRHDDRAGGGFWPDSNHIWLAAGVETYESRRQVFLSARHE
ncbi:MAG: hypothetical protein FJ034_06935, partial [Chloroflexi bacterium]|nr:hypothetical protein [Chloroflexota bacterium]